MEAEKMNGSGSGEDFYAVLGLKKECSEAELKNAYKKLALRWHPDRCSATGNSNTSLEAKEKFQEIQAAYTVLSDSNKRFLYDVGVYDDNDDDNGMCDFIGEMAHMMNQPSPSVSKNGGQDSLEDLQQLFVDMFHEDIIGIAATPSKHKPPPAAPQINNIGNLGRSYSLSTPSPTSACPPLQPPLRSRSIGSGNKRGANAMSGSGKSRIDDFTAFCFESLDSGETSTRTKPGGGNAGSKRRSGRKQKISSKHDVSS